MFPIVLYRVLFVHYTGDSLNSAYIKIQLNNSFGEKIMNETGNPSMQDNPAFLEYFKGFYVEATATNTIIYLNPDADKSRFSIYCETIISPTNCCWSYR